VLVDTDGALRLVDFDGIWIPQLAGMPPPSEYGHPNYQHPGRYVWGRWLDTFSALVIYLSLVALSRAPGLWPALYNSKNLLFSKADFLPPFDTQAWRQLAALRDPEVDRLARRLRECCDPAWVPAGSLEALLRPPAVPRAPAVPRWWEDPQLAAAPTLPAPPPLSAPLGTAGTGPMTQLRRTMAPADTVWWATPPPPPAAGPQPRPRAPGAVALGVGVLLLIIGAALGQDVLVYLGLALGAGCVYWLISRTGS
jgi:hypothetical protein